MGVPRILHYPGSKWSMAEWIISHMPPHTTYMEPFLGSGAVFFNKPPSALETINDLDGDVVNLFRVIRDHPEELAHLVQWTPYSREEYYASYEAMGDDLERARRFLVRMWQAIGGKTSDRTGWRSAIDSEGARKTKEWAAVPEKIIAVTDRLKNVQIECQPAAKLIERYKRDDVLIYADPPYILSTRSKRMYRHEMKESDHKELLDVLDAHPGPVLLSGYAHEMYDSRLKHWRRETKIVQAEAGRIRTEVLWINPIAAESIGRQLTLF
ncbi:DNA adenine methylase [Paenibacillus elgii]|uniref:DNA adenine methylase n=1 Tax=Paenibacillus elgii TaxID=189691 RepID=UPI000248D917|nr:DNA adenine methylase [Paenibacillus elgii]